MSNVYRTVKLFTSELSADDIPVVLELATQALLRHRIEMGELLDLNDEYLGELLEKLDT